VSQAVTKPRKSFFRRHPKKLITLGVFLASPLVFHLFVIATVGMTPPVTRDASHDVAESDGVRRIGKGYARKRGAILEVHLEGTPEEIGHQHGRLLYKEMIESEGQLYSTFEKYVPFSPVRTLLTDIGRFQFRNVNRGMSPARLSEIAAQARAFSPDPFENVIPTFERLVVLNSLYDISLSFEHSPLLGCTTFAATRARTKEGHTLLARNFDFEAGPIYDTGKAVFLVLEDGKIPYASVAWPGLVGAVSGMNANGLSLVVHGGRAKETTESGEPVVHTTRRLLAEAHHVEEAITLLRDASPMISHMLVLADRSGDMAVIERAPGAPIFVRRSHTDTLAVTNHFEGPFADDPKNKLVLEKTSTSSRRSRLDERLAEDKTIDVELAVDILRDKRGVGGKELALGDRDAIDAVIATHAVVMDSTELSLWVSEGPHLVGGFVKFELPLLLVPGNEAKEVPLVTLPGDAGMKDGAYDAWVARGSPHEGRAQ
jgi:isopenicillin-N N-acyltransferase like protein